ncbi:hypothetical protein, partial [Salmonella enterica]|uniref:hypothetical protein n=1 Tax=Salmonella enterica TaxID=28901 RepID=UPI0039E8E036
MGKIKFVLYLISIFSCVSIAKEDHRKIENKEKKDLSYFYSLNHLKSSKKEEIIYNRLAKQILDN